MAKRRESASYLPFDVLVSRFGYRGRKRGKPAQQQTCNQEPANGKYQTVHGSSKTL